MKKNLLGHSIGLFVLILASCNLEKQDLQMPSQTLSAEQLDAIALLGFKSETAKLTADGKCVVEGDIVLDLEKVMHDYAENKKTGTNSAEDRQRVVNQSDAIPYSTTNALTFYIEPGFTESEKTAIRAGVARWSTPVTSIVFSEVFSEPANVRFSVNNALGSTGKSPFPNGGPLSATIELSRHYTNQYCNGCLWTNLTTHELGHALGFHHTDGDNSAGGWLLYSPTDDPLSIMNSGDYWKTKDEIENIWGALPGPSADDIQMASVLYPSPNLNFNISSANFIATVGSENYGQLHVAYTQAPGNGRSYAAIIELLQNGAVVRTLNSNILSVPSSGTMRSKPFTLPNGTYQVRVRGRNYKLDFTQPGYSNTITFTK